MHRVVDDNLGMIVTERLGYFLNYSYDLDRIEGKNFKKTLEKHTITLFQFFWMKMHVLCILIN